MTSPRELADTLQRALRHHQAGRLAQAEPLYREILRAQPRHADALHLLGVLAHQVGQHAPAVDLISQAIHENPRVAGYHCNRGEALRALGRLDEAAQNCETALQLQPDYLEALINLATVRKAQGRLDDAFRACEQALRINPRHAGILNNLGNIQHARGCLAEAAAAYRAAVQLRPDYADAHANLGHALRDARDFAGAAASYEAALLLDAKSADAWFGFGIVRQMQGQLAAAAGCFRRAVELQPGHADARLNLGLALQEQNLLPAALEELHRAVRLRPDSPEAHFTRALAALTAGDFATGWREYEWRWRCKVFSTAPRDFGRPLWDGSNPAGKTFLLHAEQGWGDTLQFIRYAPLLAERGGFVSAEVPPQLARIIATAPGISQVITRGAPLPATDFHAPLMSLPGLFHTTPETIPARVPYLFPPPTSPLSLPRVPGERRIGLVWAGGTAHQKDHLRSLPFAALLPLLQIPNCQFFSLQVGPRARDLASLPDSSAVTDLSPHLADFSDTATVIAQLDLVISVDTAVAHLAGALGKPVWMLLAFAADWRWQMDRTDSAWYPTARLFRQSQRGEWSPVIAAVAEHLASALL